MAAFKVDHHMMDHPRVGMLTDKQFRKLFIAAAAGEANMLSEWVRPLKQSVRPPASVWAVIRSRIFARDDYTCQYCQERGKRLECDHIVPVSRGGPHSDDNLTTACFACNRSKRNKTLAEWRPA